MLLIHWRMWHIHALSSADHMLCTHVERRSMMALYGSMYECHALFETNNWDIQLIVL